MKTTTQTKLRAARKLAAEIADFLRACVDEEFDPSVEMGEPATSCEELLNVASDLEIAIAQVLEGERFATGVQMEVR